MVEENRATKWLRVVTCGLVGRIDFAGVLTPSVIGLTEYGAAFRLGFPDRSSPDAPCPRLADFAFATGSSAGILKTERRSS